MKRVSSQCNDKTIVSGFDASSFSLSLSLFPHSYSTLFSSLTHTLTAFFSTTFFQLHSQSHAAIETTCFFLLDTFVTLFFVLYYTPFLLNVRICSHWKLRKNLWMDQAHECTTHTYAMRICFVAKAIESNTRFTLSLSLTHCSKRSELKKQTFYPAPVFSTPKYILHLVCVFFLSSFVIQTKLNGVCTWITATWMGFLSSLNPIKVKWIRNKSGEEKKHRTPCIEMQTGSRNYVERFASDGCDAIDWNGWK